jgi:membrane-bound lytic murein transglycosylase D
MNLNLSYFFNKSFRLFLFISFSWVMISNVAIAQSASQKSDSAQISRVGFASLFNVTSTGIKEKQFKFQLNSKAVSFIQSYMDKQGPELKKMKTWAKPYFNLYDEILIANGVPAELKYLSVIESHLSSNLVSWAGAVGPWQLMPDEAVRLGLKTTPIDERTDYRKSTQAAATILKELYAQFGDWLLVVAAYNGGAGRVKQAIQKKGSKDFWQIEYELPLETRNHVKKFIATYYVFEGEDALASDTGGKLNASDTGGKLNASDTGGKLNTSDTGGKLNASDTGGKLNASDKQKKGTSLILQTDFKEVQVSGRFRIKIIAAYLKIAEKELAALNPQFDQIVSTGKSYSLKLPKDRLEIFEAHKNDILQASLQSLYSIQE